jgi:ferrous-iron efflux pump FieF
VLAYARLTMRLLPDSPAKFNRLAAVASVGVASTLIAAKLATWAFTGSVSVLSSLIDSTIDAVASVVTLISVRQAALPADRAHRFGHGKAEPLGALAQAAFIAGSALMIALEAGQRLFNPRPVEHSMAGIGVMLFAIALTTGLVLVQQGVVRRTGSIAISADRLHYQSDMLINLAVILALLLTETIDWPYFDPLFALGIIAFLLLAAWKLLRSALDMLMDRELPETERARILALALEHPGAHDVHDLRTRAAGADVFIELHLELEGRLSLAQAHEVTHQVENRIRRAYPGASILIHQEPAGVADERLDQQIVGIEQDQR